MRTLREAGRLAWRTAVFAVQWTLAMAVWIVFAVPLGMIAVTIVLRLHRQYRSLVRSARHPRFEADPRSLSSEELGQVHDETRRQPRGN